MNKNIVKLPKRNIEKTPRLLMADAYTICSEEFQCESAKKKSTYYITYRKDLESINPTIFDKGDNRIIVMGLARILEELFYDPITHEEIDEAKRFLANFKATMTGLKEFPFPEAIWRRVVDEFNGRPPIKVESLPEGSVAYPNEPVVQITSMVDGFGELAAYFESKMLQMWATSERTTVARHWFKKLKERVQRVSPHMSEDEIDFLVSVSLHDFGDRAGICEEESQRMGLSQSYVFNGTDTVTGAYQAYVLNNKQATGACSVFALAHRIVQPWENEQDCYTNLYEKGEAGDFLSMVADCYNYKRAVEEYLLPLAIRSAKNNEGKIVISRPDSGNALDQVLWTVRLAVENGLFTQIGDFKYPTTLKLIEGDGMTFDTMNEIYDALEAEGFSPLDWCPFGVGGGLRNALKRDNFSAKYALCAKENDEGVIKLSEVEGKATLPGPFKLLRSERALKEKVTIVKMDEYPDEENALELFFDGSNIYEPFGKSMEDDFMTIKNRVMKDFDKMPKTIHREGERFPASERILEQRRSLIKKHLGEKIVGSHGYAYKKVETNLD